MPPSTTIVWPVMYDDAGIARNATAVATSRGSAIRPSGVRATIAASVSGLPRIGSTSGVRVYQGDTPLTRIWSGAHSSASVRVTLRETGLRGGVRDTGRERDVTGDGPDVDHARALRVTQRRVEVAGQEQRGGQVECEQALDRRVVVARQGAAHVATGVVHEHVKRAAGPDRVDDRGTAAGSRDVGGDMRGAERAGGFGERRRIACDEKDVGAEGRELFGDRAADAAAGTGDEGRFAAQLPGGRHGANLSSVVIARTSRIAARA
jgi:hypothetical protein